MRPAPKFVALLAAVAVSVTGTAGLASAAPTAVAPTPAWGTYQTVAPARVLDTRVGIGAPKAPLAQGVIRPRMAGAGGVPTTGVSAVVLNLTVSAATKPSFLTVWPSGTKKPNASSINFVAGTNRANLVTVPLGTIGADAGKISIWNSAGTVQVIADVMGYYKSDAAASPGGFYWPDVPSRLLDTREAKFGGPLAPGSSIPIAVDYNDPADPTFDLNSHITALAVNITAVNPTTAGYLMASAGGPVPPKTSTVNFAKGTVTPNMAIVPVSPCGTCGEANMGLPSIEIINYSLGMTDVLVDIVGFYDDGEIVDPDPEFGGPVEGLRFKPTAPTRIVDTRSSLGTTTFKGTAVKKMVSLSAGPGTAFETVALVTNTTAVLPTMPTFLTLWPEFSIPGVPSEPRPGVSNLNASKGQTVANATITELGFNSNFDPAFNIYNNQGTVNVLVDVVGTMDFAIPDVPLARLAAPAAPARPQTWTRQPTAQQVR